LFWETSICPLNFKLIIQTPLNFQNSHLGPLNFDLLSLKTPLLVFNVKVKQFDFLCPLYPHFKTAPFWAPNFSTHPTQNDTILGIKIIYILKKKKKKKKEEEEEEEEKSGATPWPKWGGWTTQFLAKGP
jgi:hypothetical protein